ncbi:unnamed protein product [Sphenostylis stenocarpa]|uniref:rhamnogalacturonan endolyase n=1 Tax=Sphenostylis stenocarpa TaxID=92480 RepID=A0AA86RVC1_9FABA|nr:unnamed protein product [Sphenostylis stenocarpa]
MTLANVNSAFFNFPSFGSDTKDITFQGDAFASNGVLQLTNTINGSALPTSAGRASYAAPLRLWDAKRGELAGFTTTFSFVVTPTGAGPFGDGLSFFIAPFHSDMPHDSSGGFLGLFSADSAFNALKNQIVAVEFDSFGNKWDPASAHIGIDINSIASTKTVPWQNGNFEKFITTYATVSYEPVKKKLTVFSYPHSQESLKNVSSSSISFVVDLRTVLPEWVSVGFSGATGHLVEMKLAYQLRKRLFIHCWFRVALQLILLFLGACSEEILRNYAFSLKLHSAIISNLAPRPPPPPPAVKLTENPQQVVIGNGMVSFNLSKPKGYITGIYTGINNVLDPKNKEKDRGYLDVVWNKKGKAGKFQRVDGKNFSVIVANENIVEVSFSRKWTASMKGSSVPINIDQRYILRRGESGFYSYAIFDRSPRLPAAEVYQIRTVFKLNKARFKYMAISDARQRNMPSQRDRDTGQPLEYPEAVLLSHPPDLQFKGEVDDKYQYSSEYKDSCVHGWIAKDEPEGFWVITPSNEFRSAGPIKQDLTSHVGPTTLSMFTSPHYGGKDVTMNFGEGETYKKVLGPTFVYLNSAPNKAQFRSLWSDAVKQLSNEVRRWPYDFVGSKDFLPLNQRGTVSGRLLVQDGVCKAQPAHNAYVGLALPGDAGSWQKECKGYQFWTQSDRDGHFFIKNIVPGGYNLYAWVPGFIGDYIYPTKISIKPDTDPFMINSPYCICNLTLQEHLAFANCTPPASNYLGRNPSNANLETMCNNPSSLNWGNINLDSLVYNPPRNGPTLWEIGIPDRSAAEFYVPDPNPELRNKLYTNLGPDKFRQYGLWARYNELYPKSDLIYTVGVSDYHKDWFYAQALSKKEICANHMADSFPASKYHNARKLHTAIGPCGCHLF